MWQLGQLQPAKLRPEHVKLRPELEGPSGPDVQQALQFPGWHRSGGALLVLQGQCTCEAEESLGQAWHAAGVCRLFINLNS